MKASRLIVALAMALSLASLNAAVASAAPSDEFQFKSNFDTAAIPGFENPQSIAVNNQNGHVLILERGEVDQFDSEGNPVDFSGLGSPTIPVGGGQVVLVDNWGGGTQGNIYVIDTAGCCGNGGERFWAFTPDGKPIGSGPVETAEKTGAFMFAARVQPDGNILTLSSPFFSEEKFAIVFTPSGTQVGKKAVFSSSEMPIYAPGASYRFDELGHLYAPGGATWRRYGPEPNGTFKPEGETGLSAENSYAQLFVDPANQDLLERFGAEIRGIPYTNPLVSGTPYTLIKGLEPTGEAFGLDGSGEYLYVGEGSGRVGLYHREPPSPPTILEEVAVTGIRSDRATLHSELTTGGGDTTYFFEYGTDTSYGSQTAAQEVKRQFKPVPIDGTIEGLEPDTTYHVRLVVSNSAGPNYGADRVFKTYQVPSGGLNDPCSNALARKQTSAQRLPDCRAYELVSAGDTGGYDVESDMVPGQHSFPGFPYATDKLLYATHAGAVPGPWNATNKGPDPYLASRTEKGWVTEYKGLPANLSEAAGSFSSDLGEADSDLDSFAFAGAGLCSPCFESGLETGIPLRLPDGQLVQGMAGSIDPGTDSARPEGKVAKYFSADGKHLIFASKYAFEPGANTGGSLTVYERDLSAGTTQIVSTDESGAVLTGAGISELDVSADGSRVVVGKKVSTDSAGNEYVLPYMHIGDSADSVELAPGSTSGVLYAGMTADGSTVYFTTTDQLVSEDEDSSADLYRASVDSSGHLDLSLVTTNSTVACNPVANENGSHWNTTGSTANCDAVPIGGGGGVAISDGAVYFLSPEQFEGQGTLNQPNLYVAKPGESPLLVATLEPDNPLVLDSVESAATRHTGEFQVTPEDHFAAFTSDLPLTGVGNFGFRSVFRYDAGAERVECASCDRTGSSDSSLANNAELAPNGLSILEDGRLYFDTRYPLVLDDPNGQVDVYELSASGSQELISSGTSRFDSGLLTVSANGTDVFFFTHDTLAPAEDHNGQLMKIYDAREGGGFFVLPEAVPCKASDECHGPSSPLPPPPDIKSSGRSTEGNVLVCPKKKVKKQGKCVKRPAQHKKKHHKKAKKSSKAHGKKGGRHA